MADLQPTDQFLVNRADSTQTVAHSDLMASLQDTDLMLINRSDQTKTITGADLKGSLVPPLDLTVVLNTNDPVVGEVITATPVASGGTPPYSFTYEWKADGSSIAGATSATFTPTDSELGAALICCVYVVDNAGETLTVDSDATDPVVKGAAPPTLTGVSLAGGPRFSGQTYTSTLQGYDPGQPAATLTMKAKVVGALSGIGETSNIDTISTEQAPNIVSDWGYTNEGGITLSNGNTVAEKTEATNRYMYATALIDVPEDGQPAGYVVFTENRTNDYQGWFLGDVQSGYKLTSPEQLDTKNNLGQRSNRDTIGLQKSFATANGKSTGDTISGFSGISMTDTGVDYTNRFAFAKNGGKIKVWCQRLGDSAWIGGGNPDDVTSTPSFYCPDGPLYLGWMFYSQGSKVSLDGTAELTVLELADDKDLTNGLFQLGDAVQMGDNASITGTVDSIDPSTPPKMKLSNASAGWTAGNTAKNTVANPILGETQTDVIVGYTSQIAVPDYTYGGKVETTFDNKEDSYKMFNNEESSSTGRYSGKDDDGSCIGYTRVYLPDGHSGNLRVDSAYNGSSSKPSYGPYYKTDNLSKTWAYAGNPQFSEGGPAGNRGEFRFTDASATYIEVGSDNASRSSAVWAVYVDEIQVIYTRPTTNARVTLNSNLNLSEFKEDDPVRQDGSDYQPVTSQITGNGTSGGSGAGVTTQEPNEWTQADSGTNAGKGWPEVLGQIPATYDENGFWGKLPDGGSGTRGIMHYEGMANGEKIKLYVFCDSSSRYAYGDVQEAGTTLDLPVKNFGDPAEYIELTASQASGSFSIDFNASGGYVFGITPSVGSVYVEFQNDKDLVNFRAGDVVQDPDITVVSTDADNNRLIVTGGTWVNGDTVTGPVCPPGKGVVYDTDPALNQLIFKSQDEENNRRFIAGQGNVVIGAATPGTAATGYLNWSGSDVTGYTTSDPGYAASPTNLELTFNDPSPAGLTWDQELPAGTTIQTIVEATNTQGTANSGWSNTVTGRSLTSDDNLLEAAVVSQAVIATHENRVAVHQGEQAMQKRDDLNAKIAANLGITTAELEELVGEED